MYGRWPSRIRKAHGFQPVGFGGADYFFAAGGFSPSSGLSFSRRAL